MHAVRVGGANVELQELERQALDPFAERPHVGAAAADDAVAFSAPFATGDDQYLVRTDLLVLVRPDHEGDHEQGCEHTARDDQDDSERCHCWPTSSFCLL